MRKMGNNITKFWAENMKGRHDFGDLKIDWKLII
jgi:hypothetical protein